MQSFLSWGRGLSTLWTFKDYLHSWGRGLSTLIKSFSTSCLFKTSICSFRRLFQAAFFEIRSIYNMCRVFGIFAGLVAWHGMAPRMA